MVLCGNTLEAGEKYIGIRNSLSSLTFGVNKNRSNIKTSSTSSMPPVVQPFELSSPSLYLGTMMRSTENSQGPSATVPELLLITFALITSIALPLTSKVKSMNYFIWPWHTCFVIVISILFTLATFILAIVVLLLGWERIISMDALAGTAFALSPAILSVPMDTLQYAQLLLSLRKRRSLNVPASKLRYIRGGFLCGTDENASKWTGTFPLCNGPECSVNLFLRKAPGSSRTQRGSRCIVDVLIRNLRIFYKKCWNRFARAKDNGAKGIERQGYGIRVDHTENHIVLQDEEEGLTWWWWYLISSSMNMVKKPHSTKIVQFRDPRRLLNALELMSDIVSIGDLVLMHRCNYLKWLLQTDHTVQAAVGTTVEFTCNFAMKQVGLLEWWGPVKPEILQDDFMFPKDGAKKYGHLLFILTCTSQLFMTKEEFSSDYYDGWGKRESKDRLSGQDILDDLEFNARGMAREDFDRQCKEAVDKWLCDWGCTPHSLQKFDRAAACHTGAAGKGGFRDLTLNHAA